MTHPALTPAAPRPVVIDTDPGIDDALAIMLALASPELDVRAVTTVGGNTGLANTTENALRLLHLLGRDDVPVGAGADTPLVRRDSRPDESTHGADGFGGVHLPAAPRTADERGAVQLLVDVVEASAEPVTLIALGPLTNVAALIAARPDVAARLERIVLMGGGARVLGNMTPAAEFNIYVDPHAADVVFRSGAPIVVMPLDVTHKALTTAARIEAIRSLGTRVGDAAAALLEFFERFDEEKYGTDGGPLHDPCVIAYLLRPELFTGRHCNVEVEISSELTMGMTVVDWWGVTDRPKNAMVMRDIDADGFFTLLTDRLARL